MANLTGDQEVPVAGGPAVGDKDGSAQALVQVRGDRVTFALAWQGIGAPTLGHIHQGNAGTNGDVKVPLFTSAMPSTLNSAAGQVSVTDAALARQLENEPAHFYVNLHSKQFPGGAVRGQLKRARAHVNPLNIIEGGALHAISDGGQEVPKNDQSKVGDPDGEAITFLHARNNTVDFSMAWVNIAPPTLGHVHQGRFGQNGDVKFPLFTTPVPAGVFAVSGSLVNQDPSAIRQVQNNPGDFYSNLHTPEFPDGAVRGQLFGNDLGYGTSTSSEPKETTPGNSGGSASSTNGKAAPRSGRATLLDDPGPFSGKSPSQGVAGTGCVDVSRPGVASAVQTEQPINVWSGPGCTGDSLVISGDTTDLSKVGFNDKIASIFFGDI
ncbi:CHRD domain-containing protein [Streptomyces sp. NBC_00271]|uniref:CHRD domain-containing protein n=1 Tax=Streptomyces sp. NBC_00271 TaxID=2975697 RepID=UPI002E2A3735|nr:CHRD domain-containing protein [Streptomyces sp. NBC_00271]